MQKARRVSAGLLQLLQLELSYMSVVTTVNENRRRDCASEWRNEMPEANLVGGSQRDRERLLRLHENYIEANASFDREKLDPIWSKAPEAVFFNLNGHTYRGREHWLKLWEFYGKNVQSSHWTPFDLGGVVSGDMAVIWCHRRTRRHWTGKEPPPERIHYDGEEFITRSTMVFRKEDGEWHVVHAHFSPASSAPRPGGV